MKSHVLHVVLEPDGDAWAPTFPNSNSGEEPLGAKRRRTPWLGSKVKLLVVLCLLICISSWAAFRIVLFREAPVSSERAQTKSSVPDPATTLSPTVSSTPSNVQEQTSDSDTSLVSDCTSAAFNSDDASTFMAFRYDSNRVLFRIGNERTAFCLSGNQFKGLRKLHAPLPEYQKDDFVAFPGTDLWEPSPDVLAANRALFDLAHAGERWQLEVSPNSRIPVIVQKPVVGAYDTPFAGFLAEVTPASQKEFAASTQQYFLVHKRTPSDRGSASGTSKIGPLPEWKATPDLRSQIERILNARMQSELPAVHTESAPIYERQGDIDETWEAWANQWNQLDEELRLGNGKLDYDSQAFLLTPDGLPRLFVRAQWTINQKPAFLLALWLRAGPSLTVEAVDAQWARTMREPMFFNVALDRRYLGVILNLFDPGSDGHGALLIFTHGYEGVGITLYRYTDTGPIPTKISCSVGA